jgi:hypothetical protein
LADKLAAARAGVVMTDDELAKALNKAALARALKDADDPIRQLADRLDMSVADVLRLAAAMIERLLPGDKPTLH